MCAPQDDALALFNVMSGEVAHNNIRDSFHRGMVLYFAGCALRVHNNTLTRSPGVITLRQHHSDERPLHLYLANCETQLHGAALAKRPDKQRYWKRHKLSGARLPVQMPSVSARSK